LTAVIEIYAMEFVFRSIINIGVCSEKADEIVI